MPDGAAATDAALPVSESMLREVLQGLSEPQKQLPSKLFYDKRGSELFEEITRLPEYYLTRAERALLADAMPGWMAEIRPRSLVELGAGNADKTRVILDALCALGEGGHYVPVDISEAFLQQTGAELRQEYPELTIVPSVADFTLGLHVPENIPRPAIFTILGSTIGNFVDDEATELLARVASVMQPEDFFLLGVDLRKEVARIEAAYNDAAGVTAQFNLNVLHVLNRDLGADFVPRAFRHLARYDAEKHRIEMHLVALQDQMVHLPGGTAIPIAEGETIRTEISNKYDRDTVERLFVGAGLRMDRWRDDGLYALALATRSGR